VRIPLTRYGTGTLLRGTALLAAGAAAGFLLFKPLAAVFGALWVGLLLFFRDPERRAGGPPDELLSPADGTVRDVEQVQPPAFLEGPAVRVGIFMSLLDVHVNRSPAAGTVRWVSHHPGAFHDARTRAAVRENEHNLLGLELADGRRLLVNQIAGRIARRIVCEPAVGDALERGQRFGMVKFGSRVELYLPVADQYEVVVHPGDRVRAGRSALARPASAP
jgi:phosphatidylserine decarboxylase